MAKIFTYKIVPEDGDECEDAYLIIKLVFNEKDGYPIGPIITPEKHINLLDFDDDDYCYCYLDLNKSGKKWPNYFKFIDGGYQNTTTIEPLCESFSISCISIVEK